MTRMNFISLSSCPSERRGAHLRLKGTGVMQCGIRSRLGTTPVPLESMRLPCPG